jgi:hypothetical protein
MVTVFVTDSPAKPAEQLAVKLLVAVNFAAGLGSTPSLFWQDTKREARITAILKDFKKLGVFILSGEEYLTLWMCFYPFLLLLWSGSRLTIT